MERYELIAIASLLSSCVVGALVWIWARRRREARDTAAHASALEANLHLPASLHPVIDPDVCIGSLACIQACPEGDILGIVDGAAKLIVGANCIGHGRCAAECPVSAIKLVFGSSERGIDLPELDARFESSRSGVHIVGELGGMGLIKNAITQGLQVIDHLAGTLPSMRPLAGGVDVAIVGGGPAGLATAVAARARGLSFTVLEQGTLGGTIAHYPRQKVVMTERVKLPLYGAFGKSLISKEELLATWKRILAKTKITVQEGVRVTGIGGEDGAFTVETNKGTLAARKVVLATGRRGSPRRLDVPGEELPKVTYTLIDPEQYAGTRTLVVGGGDSALEAAIAIADAGDGEVVLSYRGEAFNKVREANRQRVHQMAKAGRLHLFLSSTVQHIAPDHVVLDRAGQRVKLPNDYVIACLGGELPSAFLQSVGVSIKRHFGEERAAHVDRPARRATPSSQLVQLKVPKKPRAAAKRRVSALGLSLLGVGVLIVAGLAAMGWDYYWLPRAARLRSPQHAFLRPAGLWGHGVGIAATGVMMSNFVYALRKRLRFLKGAGSIKSWLTWHMFVGFMSPVVILFHAAFQSNNMIATSTYLSLLIVVGTGIVGRYIYGLVPGAGGAAAELPMLRAELERQRGTLAPISAGAPALAALIARVSTPPDGKSLLGYLLTRPFSLLRTRLSLIGARRAFDDHAAWIDFRGTVRTLDQLRAQVAFYRSLKRLLSGWRIFHVVLAVLLVGIMTLHIGVSLYLGYRWIWR